MNKLLIGIEGGGTNTRLYLQVNEDPPKALLYKLSLKFSNGSFAASASRLKQMIEDASGNLAVTDYTIDALVIGLSGASRAEDQQLYKDALAQELRVADKQIYIESDASLTLRAALPEKTSGILLISGTGSVLFVRDVLGDIQRVGGWGPVLGDEGSGYAIGLAALRHFAKAMDGRTEREVLFDRVLAALPENVAESAPLIARLMEQEPMLPSHFAPLVFTSVPDSEVAAEIVSSAAMELAGMIKKGLDLTFENPPYEVTLAGSIAKQQIIVDHLTQKLFEAQVHIRLIDDDLPGLVALNMARQLRDDQTTIAESSN